MYKLNSARIQEPQLRKVVYVKLLTPQSLLMARLTGDRREATQSVSQ